MAGPIDTRFSINDSLNFYPVHDALGFAVFDAVSPWKAKYFNFGDRTLSLATFRSVFLFRRVCKQTFIGGAWGVQCDA